MLEFSNQILKRGYTIYISKNKIKSSLQGTYLKSFYDGIHPHELPQTELQNITYLPCIIEELDQGSMLQVSQSGYLVNGIIGQEKTEGPYCETTYLEVHGQQSSFDYHEMLVDLEVKLASSKRNKPDSVIQYTKLYKGVDRYE